MVLALLEFRSLTGLLTAAAVGIAALSLLIIRRGSLPRITLACLIAAIVLLVLAAGQVVYPLPRRANVLVMVDLSPSTRSATYRDRASLDHRLHELLGDRSVERLAFSNHAAPLPAGDRLADMACDRTVFAPPAADAVVLFSDGRFDLPPQTARVYAIVDGGLIDPDDLAVEDAQLHDDIATIRIAGQGSARTLKVGDRTATITSHGSTVQSFRGKSWPAISSAALSPGDAWPENDRLAFAAPMPAVRQRWWVGASPPVGWRALSPGDLPDDPAAFLSPAAVALANVPADELSPASQQRLEQYVRDLGGSVLILGGDRAFSLGGYSGGALDALSPLASDPPSPAVHWLLLTDASGSMASPAGSATRWSEATGAITAIIRQLPPNDLLSVGSFSADLRWWLDARSVRQAQSIALPPPNVAPSGPTNLQPVLEKLIAEPPSVARADVLLLTDGETKLDRADVIAAAMKTRAMRLFVLAIGTGEALPALKSICATTGGAYVVQMNSGQWLGGLRTLLRDASADRWIAGKGLLQPKAPLALLNDQSITGMNRTWIRGSATLLASAQAGSDTFPGVATQHLGSGTVLAAAFLPTDAQADAMAALVAQPPRDPRYQVDWDAALRGKVIVNASDNGAFLNRLLFTLRLAPLHGPAAELPLEQFAPGGYEAILPASTQPRLAIILLDGREIDRHPIASRYAEEFAAIGSDDQTLRALAERSGGRVIGPTEHQAIDLPWIWEAAPLTPWLATAAAVLIGFGLVRWKRRGLDRG